MDSNYVLCPCCNKVKARFTKGVDYCQVCYRKKLEEYAFYDYRVPKTKLSGTALRICEMLIEEGIERKEIHKILGLNKIYVQQVITRNAKRVNSEGKERPF